jgi:CubicO group peptidase (beta-lactamase class C family)
VGATYVVFNADKILDKGCYGIRSVNDDTSYVQLSDRFHIASNTKAITALFAAKLVEDKKIKWNTRFFDVLSDLKSQCRQDYWNITLQELLCHRAHIQPDLILNSADSIYNLTGDISQQRKAFCVEVLNQPPAYTDTADYVYSNAGIVLADCMIEKVSGKTWEEMVKEYLNTDIGIPFETGFPSQCGKNEPWGHTLSNGKFIATGYSIAPVIRPSGDLNIDVTDYAHFIQLFMKGYSGKNSFVTSSTYKYLLTAMPQYSFGWMRKNINGKEICYHFGNSGIFCSYVEYDLTDGIAAIVLVNCSDGKKTVDEINAMADDLIAQHIRKRIL